MEVVKTLHKKECGKSTRVDGTAFEFLKLGYYIIDLVVGTRRILV